jgi:hypothetical protein
MKRIFIYIILLSFFITLIGCKEQSVKAFSISIDSSVDTAYVNQEVGFTFNILPLNSTQKSVVWTITNPTTGASINDKGIFTSSVSGTFTIKVAVKDNLSVYNSKPIVIKEEEYIGNSLTEFIDSLQLNYTFDIYLPGGNSNTISISEYGYFDQEYNYQFGSLVRSFGDLLYPVYIDQNSNKLQFIHSAPIDYALFLDQFDFARWFDGSKADLVAQCQYNPAFKSYYLDLEGKFEYVNNNLVYLFDHSSLADWIVETSVGDVFGEELIGLEIVVNDAGQILQINGRLNSDTPDFYKIDEFSFLGEPLGFQLFYNNIGTTVVPLAKAFYESGELPAYSTIGDWNYILTEMQTSLSSNYSTSKVTSIINTLNSKLPKSLLPGDLDFDVEYVEEGDNYFSVIRLTLSSIAEAQAVQFGKAIQDERLSLGLKFNSVFGHTLQNNPFDIYIYPLYVRDEQTFRLNIYIQNESSFPKSELDAYLSEYYNIQVPALEGAISYKFTTALLGYGFLYVQAYFKQDVNIENINGKNILNEWKATLLSAGWLDTKVVDGFQIQDPSRTIAIRFVVNNFYDGFPVIWIDIEQALTPVSQTWPHEQLNSIGADILPVIPVRINGAYSYTYYPSEFRAVVTIVNPEIKFLQIVPILTSLGWKKILNDPVLGALMTFVSPDLAFQLSIRFNDVEHFPFTNNEDSVQLHLYPYKDTQDINKLPILSTQFGPVDLIDHMKAEAFNIPILNSTLIPSLAGNTASYIAYDATYLLGLYFADSITKQEAYGYYVEGFTPSQVASIKQWWEANYVEEVLEGNVKISFSPSNVGFGVVLIDLNDGSFLVGGVRVYTPYSTLEEAYSGRILELAELFDGAYKTKVLQLLGLLPTLDPSKYDEVQFIIKSENYLYEVTHIEIDILGVSEEDALAFANATFVSTEVWRTASIQLDCTWQQTKYVTLDGTLWYKVSIAYFQGIGIALLINIY